MSTQVEAANIALLRIGETPIQSFDDGSDTAAVVKATFSMLYRSYLSSHYWPDARRKKALQGQLSPAPINEYSYAFQLPDDFLLMERVQGPHPYLLTKDKRFLYGNSEGVDIDYIAYVDISTMSEYFVDAFAWKCAAEWAIPITDNSERARYAREQFFDANSKARLTALRNQTMQAIDTSILIRERW